MVKRDRITRVGEHKAALYTTIPQRLARASGVAAQASGSWGVIGRRLSFRANTLGTTYKINTKGGTTRVAIPVGLAAALGIGRGTWLEWRRTGEVLYAKRVDL
jgi:hypothetical protein